MQIRLWKPFLPKIILNFQKIPLPKPNSLSFSLKHAIDVRENSDLIKKSTLNFMNKSELIEEIQKRMGEKATRVLAEEALSAVLESIKHGIEKDQMVQLVGFGTFSVSERKARNGVNPQTGKSIKIAASKSVKFKPSARLKDLC